MNKNKIYSIIFIGLIVCVAGATMSVAETLTGEIDVQIDQTIGVVSPHVDMPNETSVSIFYETYPWEQDENQTVHMVNDTLKISLNITDNSGREKFILPRSIYYSVFITRSFSEAGLLKKHAWEDGFFKRLIPVKAFGAAHVVDSFLGNKTDNITIPLKYTIGNDTTHENLTLHIMVMGFLPGDADGISESAKIVEYKKVSLSATYVVKM